MIRLYARMMRRGRQTDFIPVGPEQKKLDNGRREFNFARTERMIKMFLDEGFTHIELPHIAQARPAERSAFPRSLLQSTERRPPARRTRRTSSWPSI